jgi:formylglycine-generating enzyme required for sulfatase activity
LTEGFWLFDTPVTQALWQAVMGDNPSRFKSPTRPVEQVSWDDSKNFIKKLNAEIPGLALCLPTEAQWEYACRAGTTTATYAGEMEILGERNAPVLDDIAWYGGNSGVDFDLDEGWDSSDWPQKQYDHKKAGTCRVKQKQPNSWGLYDMLGNVWEWCEDWWQGNLGSESAEGPKGTREGADRVIRGGGWFDVARVVRAAYRINFVPGDRGNFLGIRCVRLQPLANSQLQSIYKETA